MYLKSKNPDVKVVLADPQVCTCMYTSMILTSWAYRKCYGGDNFANRLKNGYFCEFNFRESGFELVHTCICTYTSGMHTWRTPARVQTGCSCESDRDWNS